VSYDPSSRSRLTPRDLERFPDSTLFHSVARVLCEAECLPRKELFESWEVARRVRRRLRGKRVLDLACGHALIANLMLLMDPEIESAVGVDKRIPKSAALVRDAFVAKWPRLTGKLTLVEQPISAAEVKEGDFIVSCHACGKLTDYVLDRAIAASAEVAVLPCCQATAIGDAGGLSGWLDPALAIDVTRAARLRAHGYHVHTQKIPEAMTAKNRLLFGERTAAPTDGM